MSKAIWFLNFTIFQNTGRALDTKMFNKLKDLRWYIDTNPCILYGFIIRSDDEGNSLFEYINGFEPSAQQQLAINNIISAQ